MSTTPGTSWPSTGSLPEHLALLRTSRPQGEVPFFHFWRSHFICSLVSNMPAGAVHCFFWILARRFYSCCLGGNFGVTGQRFWQVSSMQFTCPSSITVRK